MLLRQQSRILAYRVYVVSRVLITGLAVQLCMRRLRCTISKYHATEAEQLMYPLWSLLLSVFRMCGFS